MEKNIIINYKKILKFSIFSIIAAVLIFVFFKLAIFFMPFVIAYIIYKIIARPINFLCKKFKLPRPLAAIICIILFIGIIGVVSYLFIAGLVKELISLSNTSQYALPAIYNNITEQLSRFNFFYSELNLPSEVIAGIQNSFLGIIETFLTGVGSLINNTANLLVNAVMSLPRALIYIIITFLSTFFICSDAKFIKESLEKHVPYKWIEKAQSILNDLFSALGGYLKAQGILIAITFFELYIAFTIYDINFALILAITIAIIDALPILGTGTILIPWGLVNLVMGNYRMAAYLIILYLFVLVVRQLIEPKIVGTQIGIYPLLTLAAMYTGVQLIGVFGVIVGPIVLIVLRNILKEIYKKGMIKELFGYKEQS